MVELLVGLVAGLVASGFPAAYLVKLQTEELVRSRANNEQLLDRVRSADERLLSWAEDHRAEIVKAQEAATELTHSFYQLPEDEVRYLYDDSGLVQSVEPMTDNG